MNPFETMIKAVDLGVFKRIFIELRGFGMSPFETMIKAVDVEVFKRIFIELRVLA